MHNISVRLSGRLSVTEVHWRIIANLGFKFRSNLPRIVVAGRGHLKFSTTSRAMLATARPSCKRLWNVRGVFGRLLVVYLCPRRHIET